MCVSCEILKQSIEVAPKNAHSNYSPILLLISELIKQKRIVLYYGDCELSEIGKILFEEKHYTVCHYFKCTNCCTYFFVGACIRGTPSFKIFKKITDNDIKKMIWGNSGVLKN